MLDKRIEYDTKVPIRAYVSHIYQQPVHAHREDLELIVVMKGTIRVIVGFRTLLLGDGDVMFFNDRELHGIYETEGENLVLTIHIKIKYFRKYNETAYSSFFLMAATYLNDLRYDKPLEELREQLFNIAKVQIAQAASDEKMETMGRDLLAQLLADFQYFYYSTSGGKHFINRYEGKNNQAQAARIRMLMYYLWENYNQKITLQEYADESHINMYYLSHIIKDSTGLSFQELLSFTRVEASETLLLETDKKISEIAFECGFSATRYYVKHFEKWFQISPEEYRAKHTSRLTLKTKEDIFAGEEAIDMIDALSGQKRHLPAGKSYFYTDVLEIDVGKKSKTRRKRYQQLIEWDCNFLPEETGMGESLKAIGESFRLCVPVMSAKSLNSRLLAFLQESGAHSLLFVYDAKASPGMDCGAFAQALGRFCRSGKLSSLVLYIEYAGGLPETEKDEIAKVFREAGEAASCRIAIKEVCRCSSAFSGRNYFLDSIYAVPWIIRSNLKSGHEQRFMSKIFDESTAGVINGEAGMITASHIKKPSYYAYMCLALLGNEVVENSEGYIVTKKNQDLVILLYDYDNSVFHNLEKYSDCNKLAMLRFATKKNKEYKLELSNLEGRYTVTEIRFGKEICLFSKMVDLGMPEMLMLEEEQNMRDFMKPRLEFSVVDGRHKTASLDVKVPRYGAALLQLRKMMES